MVITEAVKKTRVFYGQADRKAEAPVANFFLRISAKILSISAKFLPKNPPQKARNHDICDKKST